MDAEATVLEAPVGASIPTSLYQSERFVASVVSVEIEGRLLPL